MRPELLLITFGKAAGMSGAALLCNQQCGDYLQQFARHHVYSTAMPPAQAHALSHAVTMIQQQDWRREKLQQLQYQFAQQCQHLPGYVATESPIKPFICGSAEQAVQASKNLSQQGIWVSAIRPPTVAQGQARLRITLSASHSFTQLKQLTNALAQLPLGDSFNGA